MMPHTNIYMVHTCNTKQARRNEKVFEIVLNYWDIVIQQMLCFEPMLTVRLCLSVAPAFNVGSHLQQFQNK